jgi:hypothetical protein
MNKRQIKKLSKHGIEEMKKMDKTMPLSTKKIQHALFLYLQRNGEKVREPRLYRETWSALNEIRNETKK